MSEYGDWCVQMSHQRVECFGGSDQKIKSLGFDREALKRKKPSVCFSHSLQMSSVHLA